MGEILEKSSFYQLLEEEKDEIQRHKWLESEKMGRDIGMECAIMHWTRCHRNAWMHFKISQSGRFSHAST